MRWPSSLMACGAVVGRHASARHPIDLYWLWLPLDHADNQGMAELLRDAGDHRPEVRVLKRKWRGRFRPNQKIRLAAIGRRAQAQLLQIRHICFVFGIPIAHILKVFREIRLHDARNVVRLSFRHESRTNDDYEQALPAL